MSCILLCHCNLSICLSPIVITSGFSSLICPSLFQIAVFCPGKSSSSPAGPAGGEVPGGPRRHCLVLLLRKENATHHIPALLTGNAALPSSLGGRVCISVCLSSTSAVQPQLYSAGNIFWEYQGLLMLLQEPPGQHVNQSLLHIQQSCLTSDLESPSSSSWKGPQKASNPTSCSAEHQQ